MVKSDQFSITPIVASSSLRTLAYEALKAAITKMDIYGRPDEVRLDERKLSQDLGVSRTPVREALTVLEQEGFVRSEARRGVFVIKKTKKEIVGMIHAWAALESMAARLACERATDAQLKSLREIFPEQRPGSFTYLPEHDRWVWTTFNSFQWDLNYSNPAVFNAMSEEMTASWVSAVEQLGADRSVRVVVVTGEGSSFCSGGNTGWIASEPDAEVDHLRTRMLAFYRAWLSVRRLGAGDAPAPALGLRALRPR